MFISQAYAQSSGGAPSGASGFFLQIAPLLLIFVIFYFLMIRPQQKQRRQHEENLRNLQKGDDVVTSGGIIGQVVHIREATKDGAPVKSMSDQVTIKSAESRLLVERGKIASVNSAKRAEATSTTSAS